MPTRRGSSPRSNGVATLRTSAPTDRVLHRSDDPPESRPRTLAATSGRRASRFSGRRRSTPCCRGSCRTSRHRLHPMAPWPASGTERCPVEIGLGHARLLPPVWRGGAAGDDEGKHGQAHTTSERTGRDHRTVLWYDTQSETPRWQTPQAGPRRSASDGRVGSCRRRVNRSRSRREAGRSWRRRRLVRAAHRRSLRREDAA